MEGKKPFNLLAPQEQKKSVPRHKRDPKIKELIKCMLSGMSMKEAGLAVGFSEDYMRSQVYKTGAADHIKSEVAKRTAQRSAEAKEKAKVQTDEIIGNLVQIMEGSIADVLPENEILQKAKVAGVDHLIKKLVVTPVRVGTRTRKNKDGSITTSPVIKQRIDLEMHDRLNAIQQLRDTYGLKSEPRPNNYEEQKRIEVMREIQLISVAEGIDEMAAAETLLANLADSPDLTRIVKQIMKKLKPKEETGTH